MVSPATPETPAEDPATVLPPRERAGFRRDELARIEAEIQSGALSPDNLNQRTEEEHTAQVEGVRAQLAKFRRDLEDRLRLEASGAPLTTGLSSRQILHQVTAAARKLSAAERARARFREWRRVVDNIDALKAVVERTPGIPALPYLRALEAYVAARVEAGMGQKSQLREIRQKIADLE